MAEQSDERQLVVFDLSGEAYGVNIETVREIIRMQTVTYVPDTPDFVEGVTEPVNLYEAPGFGYY